MAALTRLAAAAHSVAFAYSYVQTSGWSLVRDRTSHIPGSRVRLLFTDQFGITQPTAIRDALSHGIDARRYSGGDVFHPKVAIAYSKANEPIAYIVGSANLSGSALLSGVEAAVVGSDPTTCRRLDEWFQLLFEKNSERIDARVLSEVEARWLARARASTGILKGAVRPKTPKGVGKARGAGDGTTIGEAVSDVFSAIPDEIVTLGFDLGGNNVRTIEHAQDALRSWSVIRSANGLAGKKRSELKTLGLADGSDLTALGKALRKQSDPVKFLQIWCDWLAETRVGLNPRLAHAKSVLTRFWTLREEVRDFFLQNAEGAKKDEKRIVLQTIEVLCNVCEVLPDLSLSDVKALTWIVESPELLPELEKERVTSYLENKGMRSWKDADRTLVPVAWKNAAGL